MAWHDDVAEKRLETRQNQTIEARHREGIDTVNSNGSVAAKTSDIVKLTREVQTVSKLLLLNQQENSKIDYEAIEKCLSDIPDGLNKAIQALNMDDRDRILLEGLHTLEDSFSELKAALKEEYTATNDATAKLIQAVNAIQLSPVIKVPTPKVSVEATKVDFKSLETTLKGLLTPKNVPVEKVVEIVKETVAEPAEPELEDFKAQDLKEDGAIQYVGFLHTSGAWYILENNTQANTLRYVFGKSGYQEAFDAAANYQYELLDEAIHALKT